MSAAAQQAAAGKFRAQFLNLAAGFGVPVAIRKSHHAVRVRDVKKLRLRSRRIERDSERIVESAADERFSELRFSVAIGIAQGLDDIRMALRDEDVAVRRRHEKARIDESAREFFDLETIWDPKLCAGRAAHHARPVVR